MGFESTSISHRSDDDLVCGSDIAPGFKQFIGVLDCGTDVLVRAIGHWTPFAPVASMHLQLYHCSYVPRRTNLTPPGAMLSPRSGASRKRVPKLKLGNQEMFQFRILIFVFFVARLPRGGQVSSVVMLRHQSHVVSQTTSNSSSQKFVTCSATTWMSTSVSPNARLKSKTSKTRLPGGR